MSQVLMITGGSRGIGAATARLAAPHYAICINYHRQQQAAEASYTAIGLQRRRWRPIAVERGVNLLVLHTWIEAAVNLARLR